MLLVRLKVWPDLLLVLIVLVAVVSVTTRVGRVAWEPLLLLNARLIARIGTEVVLLEVLTWGELFLARTRASDAVGVVTEANCVGIVDDTAEN